MTDNEVNLAAMSDEEILAFEPSLLGGTDVVESEPVTPGDDSQSAPGESDPVVAGSEEGGTSASGEPAEDEAGEAGSTSPEGDGAGDTQNPFADGLDATSEDDQSNDQGTSDTSGEDDESQDTNWKEEYDKLMAPFRAAKREVTLESPEDARRLMQMGVDYSRKMEAMKPHLRVIRTLEKAGLADIENINFLIDLSNKEPEAIKKLLRDSDIDPMTLDIKSDGDYSPNDNLIGDEELALTEVLKSIEDTPSFERTVEIVTTGMDTKSRAQLKGNPELIATINDHVAGGIYDSIMDKVASERLFGRLAGLSDLEAYYKVGDAIYKAGGFEPASSDEPSTGSQQNQASAQDSNAENAPVGSGRKDQRRAAASSRGSAGTGGKAPPNIMAMSDEEILNLDLSSLM